MYFYFNPFSVQSRFTIYHYTSMHTHIHVQCMYTCFRCARNLYYANIFCRVLPRSKCYSSKTYLQGRRKHFQIERAPKCKPQIESRSRNLITKWKYKLEDILKLTPPPPAKTKNVLWAYILQKPHKILSVKVWLSQYEKRLNNIDHMRISSTEPSSVILSQTKWLKSWKEISQSAQTNWSQKGIVNKPQRLQFE